MPESPALQSIPHFAMIQWPGSCACFERHRAAHNLAARKAERDLANIGVLTKLIGDAAGACERQGAGERTFRALSSQARFAASEEILQGFALFFGITPMGEENLFEIVRLAAIGLRPRRCPCR